MTRARLTDLDLAKGLAIFLVVLGHVVARETPPGNDWYALVKAAVYKFHMPFFMFLSGTVFQLTWRPPEDLAAYRRTLGKRAKRLIPGFLLFAVIIWAGKWAASQAVHVDNVQTGWESLLRIVTMPSASVAASLWYVYVLMQLYAAFPLLMLLCRQHLGAVVAIGFALHAFGIAAAPLPEWFAIDRFCEYAFFFALGLPFAAHHERIRAWVTANALPCVAVFALSFGTIMIWPGALSKTWIGLASLPAVFAIAVWLGRGPLRTPLLVLSEFTFTIYLMNTLAIGFTKALLFEIHPWDGAAFFVYFPVLLAVGVAAPILAYQLVIRHLPGLRDVTK